MEKTKPNRTKRIKSDSKQLNIFFQLQLFSVAIYLSLFIISSIIALKADLPRKYDFLISLIIFAIASFGTGFFAGLKLRQNGLLVGIIYSLPMNFTVLLISLIINKFSFDLNLAISAIILILSAAIGGILAVNKRLRR